MPAYYTLLKKYKFWTFSDVFVIALMLTLINNLKNTPIGYLKGKSLLRKKLL